MTEKQPLLIALAGPAGCGKSTIACELEASHDFKRLRFAGPLKDMLRVLGLTEEQVDGDLKEEPCELLCGKTSRHAMQTLGTQWGRNWIGKDLWARATLAKARKLLDLDYPVVIDDCRFPNEVEAVRAAGGVVVEVCRPGVLYGRNHVSAQPLAGELIDYRISNANTPAHAVSELLLKTDPSWHDN